MRDIMDLIERGKIKRYFRVRGKYSFEGAVNHVTQRAPGKEPLFLEESDYLYMLHLIKETAKKFNLCVLSLALMLNHIHLLIKLHSSNLANAMRSLFQAYAIYFNKKYERKGHVFCSAYRSALCLEDSYLLAASLYIHLNPVRAKLVTKPVDYRWSSCALFLNDVNKDTFLDYRFILSVLDTDRSRARLKYISLLEQIDVGQIKDVLEEPNALESIANVLRSKLPILKKREDKELTKECNILGDAELYNKIEKLKMNGALRGPQERKARKFLIEQLKSRGFKIIEIAEKLNLSRQSVHKYLSNNFTFFSSIKYD